MDYYVGYYEQSLGNAREDTESQIVTKRFNELQMIVEDD